MYTYAVPALSIKPDTGIIGTLSFKLTHYPIPVRGLARDIDLPDGER